MMESRIEKIRRFRRKYETELFLFFGLGTLVNTLMIAFGVYTGIKQRQSHAQELRNVQIEMSAQVLEAADIKKKQDSILARANELRNLIH